MCDRYKLTVPFSEIVRLYNLTNSVNHRPRYNIAPSQDVLAVVYDAERMACFKISLILEESVR